MDPEKIILVEEFVDQIKDDPSILDLPALDFFKDFLLSLGAQLPKPTCAPADDARAGPAKETESAPAKDASSHPSKDAMGDEDVENEEPEEEEEEQQQQDDDGNREPEEEEEDLERLPQDTAPFPELGPGEVELTNEDHDKQAQAKQA